MHVLIVEDEPFIAASVEDALGKAGIATRSAGNAAEALRLAETTRFDLALLDVRLGYGESGLMLAEMLLESHAVPTLLLTGLNELPAHVGAFVLGVLHKPFSGDDVVAAVHAVRRVVAGQPVEHPPRNLTFYGGRTMGDRERPAFMATV
jgi:DNA-binding response OmpR family regulator